MNYWGIPGVPKDDGTGLSAFDHHVIQTACEYFKVTKKEMSGKSRKREIIHPRQVTMYLLAMLSRTSLTKIGRAFDRDHTTVIHTRDKVNGWLPRDSTLQTDISTIKTLIQNQLFKK